jgi:predicted O-methyltransferase YrrM
MHVLKQLRRPVGDIYRRLRTRRDLSGLADTNQRILAAIVDTVSCRTNEAEKTWIERIEELRRQMNGSPEELEVNDYGAASGDSKLSADEMRRGRVIRRTIGQICTTTSATDRRALLLLRLVRELKPRTCIELGTSVGISGCYQAAALKLNGAGKLITLEGADSVASVAIRNFANLRLDNVEVFRGRFEDTLSKALSANSSVDYAFIDGHHDEAATVKYFYAFIPALADIATIVFDDINWSDGMKRAWDAIRRHKRVRASVDLGSIGVISTASTAGDSPPQHFRCAF